MSSRNTRLFVHIVTSPLPIAMQMSLTAVIAISLSGLVCDWVSGRAATNVHFSEFQTQFDNYSDGNSVPKQSTPKDSTNNLSLKNTRAGRRQSTRESAITFDSPTKTASTDYELVFKNASADTVLPSSLIRKIVSILGKRPAAAAAAPAPGPGPGPGPTSTFATTGDPNKQLFGGRLPPFIERIIQRIQNYFSVYNPPEYFDGNRPPPLPSSSSSSSSSGEQHSEITLICTNTTSGSVSCSETDTTEAQQEEEEAQQQGETLEACDGALPSNSQEGNTGVDSPPQDEYNVVVTHTVVQDSSLNVYSPAPAPAPAPVPFANVADSTHMVSNVVVILEPAAGQYSPPPLDNPDKNKFYVYVNPTSANKNPPPQRLKTWNESVDGSEEVAGEAASAERISNFQPFVNTTYTVIIRGDKLQEYNTELLQNADNDSLNPQIAIYVRNATTKKRKKCKLPSQPANADADAEDCDRGGGVSLTSSSVPLSTANNSSDEKNGGGGDGDGDGDETKAAKSNDNENPNKVPNLNLMLVPPNERPFKQSKNKSCASKTKVTKNPQLEYYILKPENPNRGKTDDKEKATFYLHKTNIGAATLSQTYLPPTSTTSTTSPASLSLQTSTFQDRRQNGQTEISK